MITNVKHAAADQLLVMMKAASLKNINKSFVINRSDSGDVTGDKSEVVGYLSAVVYSD